MQAQNYPAAVELLKRVTELEPKHKSVWNDLGSAYLAMRQTDNAIKDYDAALKGDSRLAGSLYGRGIAKTRKGDRAGGSADIAAAKDIKKLIDDQRAADEADMEKANDAPKPDAKKTDGKK